MSKVDKIKFKGQRYIIVGGAITTKDLFEHGRASYAHLFPDGKVKRYGKTIGTKEDIEYVGKVTVKPGVASFEGLLTDPAWFMPPIGFGDWDD